VAVASVPGLGTTGQARRSRRPTGQHPVFKQDTRPGGSGSPRSRSRSANSPTCPRAGSATTCPPRRLVQGCRTRGRASLPPPVLTSERPCAVGRPHGDAAARAGAGAGAGAGPGGALGRPPAAAPVSRLAPARRSRRPEVAPSCWLRAAGGGGGSSSRA
jgi:hypothetical protein